MALTLAQIEARVDTAGRHPGWVFVRRHPLLVIGGVVLAMMVLIALLAPWLAPHSPIEMSMLKRLKAPSSTNFFAAIEAMKKGAFDYLLKPFRVEELVFTVQRIFRCKDLSSENRFLKEERKSHFFETGILGNSVQIREILAIIANVSRSRASVLIDGESGTGEELIAQAIHFLGNRAEKMSVPINCGAIRDNLLEPELFGHVKGAFRGATESKQGLFQFAQGGTLFLDEIGDLSGNLQAKLLRVLHDGRIGRVGDFKEIDTDVRVVAATNKDLLHSQRTPFNS